MFADLYNWLDWFMTEFLVYDDNKLMALLSLLLLALKFIVLTAVIIVAVILSIAIIYTILKVLKAFYRGFKSAFISDRK